MSDNEQPHPYDLDKPRRLEIRVRTSRDFELAQIGHPTEREANRNGRVTADVMVMMRGMIEEDGRLSVNVATLEGYGLQPISPSAQFHLWLSFTSSLAAAEVDPSDEDAVRQVAYLKKMLMLLQLDEGLRALGDAATAEGDATPPGPPSPPDDAPPSSG